MKRLLPLVVTVLSTFAAFSAAAQTPNVNVRFALHAIEAPTGKTPPPICSGLGAADPVTNGIPCGDFTTTRPANSASWVYLVLGNGNAGINGASFGIEYSGINEPTFQNLSSWTLCSDGLDFPSDAPPWPESGSGMLLTWVTCQQTALSSYGIHATVAKFYVYAYAGASLAVTPNNTKVTGPELDVNTCGQGVTKLLNYTEESMWYLLMGRLDFGGGAGFTPCSTPTGTESSTWGGIKRQFPGKGN